MNSKRNWKSEESIYLGFFLESHQVPFCAFKYLFRSQSHFSEAGNLYIFHAMLPKKQYDLKHVCQARAGRHQQSPAGCGPCVMREGGTVARLSQDLLGWCKALLMHQWSLRPDLAHTPAAQTVWRDAWLCLCSSVLSCVDSS